jgi:hypothetical protein
VRKLYRVQANPVYVYAESEEQAIDRAYDSLHDQVKNGMVNTKEINNDNICYADEEEG